MKSIPAIHPVITENIDNVLVKRAPQRLIIGKPISQYASYSDMFCLLYSNISSVIIFWEVKYLGLEKSQSWLLLQLY